MKIISYILTPIWGIVFIFLIGIFHPVQWVCLKLFGYEGHKNSVDFLNLLLMKSILILGHRVSHVGKVEYPRDSTVIFVSNHQSMFDVPPLIWYLRKTHPKFVAKKELGKGIPSISFNLKYGGSVLIDRKDKSISIPLLKSFAKKVKENKWSVIIFPEGTRSHNSKQKKFSFGGLSVLLKETPDVLVVPISIKDTWKVTKYGKFPLGLGANITMTTHKAMEIGTQSIEEFISKIEAVVKSNGLNIATN